ELTSPLPTSAGRQQQGSGSDLTRGSRVVKRARMQAALDGPGRHFGARSNAELVPDAFHMTLGGSLGDEQTLSDRLVGHPRSHREPQGAVVLAACGRDQ